MLQFLWPKGPPLLEAPQSADEYLLHRADGGSGGIALGTSVAVAADERAVVVAGNRIIEVLDPGIHLLDRSVLAELAALYSWPGDYHGPIHAEVVFVSGVMKTRRVWQLRPSKGARDSSRATVSGTFAFRVADSTRFVAGRLDDGIGDDDGVYRAIEKLIAVEFRALAEGGEGLDKRLAPALSRRVAARLEAWGVTDFTATIRGPGRATPAGAMEHAADATVTADDPNVAQLAPRATAETNPETESAPGPTWVFDQEPEAGTGDAIPELMDIEADIRRLDAWATIAARPAGEAGADPDPEPADTDFEEPDASLPEHLRATNFYVAVDMKQNGPFDAGAFTKLIDDGKVSADTLVWFPGMKDWQYAGDIPELAGLVLRPR